MAVMDGPGLASIATSFDFQIPLFDTNAWLQIIILVLALILCGTASAAETALTSVSRIKLRDLIEEGDQRAVSIERILAEPNVFLSTILFINTVTMVIAAGITTALALRFSANWGLLLAILLTSAVLLVFCQIAPKTIAVQNPLRWARFLVGPVMAFSWFLRPTVWSLGKITTLLIRLTGGQIKRQGPFVTEEELRRLLTVGEEEGVLEEEETEMINSIFEFADTTVREVMVPRIDMVTLASDATVNEAVDLALQGGFSRIPVYEAERGVDEIIGVLYTKDMLKQLRDGHNTMLIRDLLRPAYFVPESKKLDELLQEIRQNRVHIVMVVDEYGSVTGLVTIEDLVEEIVGDIKDEYDHEENLYEKVSDDTYIFDAKISIYDFNELMDMHLDDRDYETLGGFVYSQLDKIPSAGDTISFEDLTFTVLSTRGRRITQIRVERRQPTDQSPEVERSADALLLPSSEEHAEKNGQQEDAQQSSEQPSRYEYREA